MKNKATFGQILQKLATISTSSSASDNQGKELLKVRFSKKPTTFFAEIRSKTEAYFKENNIRPTGDYRLWVKTIFFILAFTGGYVWLVFFTPEMNWLSIIACVVMGGLGAGIGFNIMHDGAHGSYSRKKWVNKLMATSLNILGGNVLFWSQKHNENHHTFTNVEGMDDDIDLKPFFRVHSEQKKYKIHRFQHIYWVILYGLTYTSWVFYRDFKKYFTSKIADHTELKKFTLKDHFNFWIYKVVFIGIFIVIPLLTVGWLPMLIGFNVMAFVLGWILAIVFQLAHVVEETEFVNPTAENPDVQEEWAIHQMATTANFAPRNKFISWCVGGLNYQVEHHLFPKISHVHYPQISKIVMETSRAHGIPYYVFPTMRSAIASHVKVLKKTGRI
ncbi:MAG: fatty acid desaturase family protein [Bacteroidota bacterium]